MGLMIVRHSTFHNSIYYCRHCSSTRAIEVQNNIARGKLTQTSFLSSDESILERLLTNEPGVFEMFPTYLSKRAGLDKTIFKMIVENAIRGIGPSSTAASAASHHISKWQPK
jgi:hypothetical protein